MDSTMEEDSALANRAPDALVAVVWSFLGDDSDHHDHHHQQHFKIDCLHQHQFVFIHIAKHSDTSIFVAPVCLLTDL